MRAWLRFPSQYIRGPHNEASPWQSTKVRLPEGVIEGRISEWMFTSVYNILVCAHTADLNKFSVHHTYTAATNFQDI